MQDTAGVGHIVNLTLSVRVAELKDGVTKTDRPAATWASNHASLAAAAMAKEATRNGANASR